MNETAIKEVQGTSKWCAGLPEQSQRTLTPEEISAVQIESKHASRKVRMYLLYIPLFAILFAMLAFAIGSLAGQDRSTLVETAAIIGLLLVLGWPILFVLANNHQKFNKALKRTLENGTVLRFEGTLDKRLADIPPIVMLRKHRLIDKDLSLPTSIDVGDSGILLSIDQKGIIEKRILANIVEVANPPDFARLAAKYVQPTEEPGVARHQRNITDEEKLELQKHYRKTFSHGSILWTLFLVVIGPGILLIQLLRGAKLNDIGVNIFVSLLAALSLRRLISALKVALKIKRDLQSGFVFIEQRSEPGSSKEVLYEYLPASLLLWTENYLPAAWRTY